MTETMNTSGRRLAPELSGVDLVRVAPHQAREAAKARDESGTCKEMRCTRAAISRGDGREPSGFAAVLQGLAADRAWDIPAAGGSILDQRPDVAAAFSPKPARALVRIARRENDVGYADRDNDPVGRTSVHLVGPSALDRAGAGIRYRIPCGFP
ncbi:hypothetical protein OG711_37865 [Streptomyces uncialis]|uniref:hypothetical protein n=1 Tax=Streptomyces uncialis TaxID=1048205 RepID=UPI002E2EB0EF|nr:hypothetical protein [Streptomyces uncialis]WTE08868.1 hypothetical protein OG924_00305 [Streptomyces uncialis]